MRPLSFRENDDFFSRGLSARHETYYDRSRRTTSKEVLQRQPFSLIILTLMLFMVEAIKDEFGEQTMKSFEHDLREAYRKLPVPKAEAN